MILALYFVVIAAAFFVLIVRPQRRRLAVHRAFVAGLALGDEVVTSGGLFGTVRALRDDVVELEVAAGVVVTVARAAIAQRARPDASDGAGDPDDLDGLGDPGDDEATSSGD